jgi:hypothetical protein
MQQKEKYIFLCIETVKKGMVIPPGTTSCSWMRNPPEESNSAGNYRRLDDEATGGMEFRQKLPPPE